MKSFFKKLAFVMALAMVVTLAAPAAQSAFAATNFTYAEQKSGAKVTAVTLKVGETIDLKFVNVPDYKNYTLKWVSSNEKVATVDGEGLIKAVANGSAEVELLVGDGKAYTSTPVKVTVGETAAMKVTIGINGTADRDLKATTLEAGKSIKLNFYGVTDWATGKYTQAWTSNKPEVVGVDQKGNITALTAGTATVAVNIYEGATVAASATIEVTVPAQEVAATGFEAEQITDSKIELTFADKSVTKSALEKGLTFYYYVAGKYQIEVPLIKTISDVKDGVVTVELYNLLSDGVVYGFAYGDDYAEFVGQIGDVTSMYFEYDAAKAYVTEESEGIKLTPVLLNDAGIDITNAALSVSGAYIYYEEKTYAENGEYSVSEDAVYFTEPGSTIVVARYVVPDAETGDEVVVASFEGYVTAFEPVPYAMNFMDSPVWTIAELESANWNNKNTKIAVGDTEDTDLYLYLKVKDNRGEEYILPDPNTTEMEETYSFRYESTNVGRLYVSEDGQLMPNSEGKANILVYAVPNEGRESLVAVIPVTVSPARTVNSIDIVGSTSATISACAPYNTATFTVLLKDNLGTPCEGETLTVKSTSNKAVDNKVVNVVATQTGADGKSTITVTADEDCVKDEGYFTFAVTVTTANGKSKKLNVTVRDVYRDNSGVIEANGYKLAFSGATEINGNANLVLKADLTALSNSVSAFAQEITGSKLSKVADAVVGKFYYTVSYNNEDITKDYTSITGASNSTIAINLNKVIDAAESEDAYNVVDNTKGAGNYKVTVYQAVDQNKDGIADTYKLAKSAIQVVSYTQKSMNYVGKTEAFSDSSDATEIVKNCFQFKFGNDVVTNWSGYEIVVDFNNIDDKIVYINSVTFFKAVNGGAYDKYTVKVNDYVTVNE